MLFFTNQSCECRITLARRLPDLASPVSSLDTGRPERQTLSHLLHHERSPRVNLSLFRLKRQKRIANSISRGTRLHGGWYDRSCAREQQALEELGQRQRPIWCGPTVIFKLAPPTWVDPSPAKANMTIPKLYLSLSVAPLLALSSSRILLACSRICTSLSYDHWRVLRHCCFEVGRLNSHGTSTRVAPPPQLDYHM